MPAGHEVCSPRQDCHARMVVQGQLGTLGKAEYPNADGGVFIDMNIGDAAAQQVYVIKETWAEQTMTGLMTLPGVTPVLLWSP